MTWKPDIMLYHANCADGFGAAWAAWMRWGDAVEYIPVSYGQAPPDVSGKQVLIGDFSYKRDQLADLSRNASSIVVLDHHKTAEEELSGYNWGGVEPLSLRQLPPNMPPCIASFDMNRSGAVMTWQFCHPGEGVPLLLSLIEDRDLWRFTMQETKPFGVWLRCEPFSFQRWNELSTELEARQGLNRIMGEADAMQRFFDQKVGEIARLSRRGLLDGHEVPLCNCPPMFASEVGHWLLDENPSAPFVACYSDQGKARGYSLRSRDDRMDVAEIAKKFGGGGHRNAAGFGVPLL